MNVGVILALAEYFTGPRVVAESIALQVPGKMREEAQAFFKVRAALGILGYPERPEAVRQITRALERHNV